VVFVQEIEEENFVITSLLNAAEEGNIETIQELTDNSSLFDINIANRVIKSRALLASLVNGLEYSILFLLLTFE